MSDHITLVGNIVGDPEERSTRAGDSIAAFRLAVGERRFDRDRNSWVDGHTSYYSVSAFGELGRNCLAALHKGERVVVAGRLRLREWENDTKRGVSADVTADAVGHDLRWGVSRFERMPRPETSRASDAADQSGGGDAWAVPGASPGDGAADVSSPGAVANEESDSGSVLREAVETPF